VVTQREGTERRNRLFLVDLSDPKAAPQPFLDRFDAEYSVVGNEGDTFYVLTNQGAPRGRLVAIKRGSPEPGTWKELIPQGPDRDVLVHVDLVGNRFAATWMTDASEKMRLYALDGTFQQAVALPTLGTLGIRVFGWNTKYLSGGREDPEGFFSFSSFTYPTTVYRLDVRTGAVAVFKAPKVDFKPSDFEVSQVFYPGKDGTKIPMFLVHKKGLKLDGQNPTLLYGYGGFNASMTPGFNVARAVWLEMGGVYAMPNLRGGGEYGKAWHDAGKLARKQNTFDDFIAAAEWLIANKYTNAPRLAINGASNGGLLVGACMTQRPDLFGATLPQVGVMDMLRYHKFTIGWAWKSDYDCSEDAEGFKRLMTYSPLHTLKPGVKYPATLVTTGDHDDRVVPAHSHKFIATLQACQGGSAPVLTRIETNAGHGAGKPTAKQIAEFADQWAFLVKNLGMKLPEGFGQ
jgi:prolyl oligopeptidase